MTVSSQNSKAGPYAGSGSPGPFPVTFRFLDATHLEVIKTSSNVDTTLAYPADYSVAGVGNPTGSVTLTTPLLAGEKLTILRDVPITQEADYVANDSFPAESHEAALDKLTMIAQELKEAQGRSLTLPGSASGVSSELPPPVSNNLIGWDFLAQKLQNVDPATLATIVAYGTARADLFSGDGVTTAFTLYANPGAQANLDVSIGGVSQRPGVDFTWASGQTLTFTVAPPAGTDNVLARYIIALPQGTYDSAAATFIQAGTGAVQRTAQDKMREWITPEDFGAIGDNSIVDVVANTAALNRWANAVRDLKIPGRGRNTTYRITESGGGLIITGHRGTVIDFCGAVFKARDGEPVISLNGGITFSDNQDCHFLNGTYDGNRSARTPGPEVLDHGIAIWENNARVKFTKFRAINGVVDGWYLRGIPSNLASYPTDITLEDCEGLNNFRNNMSPIGSVGLKVVRGRYNNAIGLPPQAGIDVEPNIEDIHGNIDIELIDVETAGNSGYGTSLGGFFPASGKIRGLRSYGNKGCALKLATVDDIDVIDTNAGDMSVLDRGVIDVGAEAKNVRIRGVHVNDITATAGSDRSAVYIHAGAVNVSVKDVGAESCSVPTLISYSPDAILRGIETQDCTATASAVLIGATGSKSIATKLSSRRTTGPSFECIAPNCDVSDIYAEDSASTVASARIWSAGNTVRGIKVHQTSGVVPAGANAVRVEAVQAELSSVTATGGYTAANTIFGTADKFVGTKISNISPDPFATSFVFDPPSLASGSSFTSTTPLSKANLGDACVVSAPYDLQGVIATASVSAAGAVRVSLYNPTAGTIDLASGTWTVSLKKS